MTERDASNFFYSIKGFSAKKQEAAIQAKLAEDPTLTQTMSWGMWPTNPHNRTAFPVGT